jgi:hypothetical protein
MSWRRRETPAATEPRRRQWHVLPPTALAHSPTASAGTSWLSIANTAIAFVAVIIAWRAAHHAQVANGFAKEAANSSKDAVEIAGNFA